MMANIKLSLNISAPPEIVDLCAHYHSEAWDPFSRKMHCVTDNRIVDTRNRLKITGWHGQSMIVEYICVKAPFIAAMKMIKGPAFLEKFSGAWQFRAVGYDSTQARWNYPLRAAKKCRLIERIIVMYFSWESRRRLLALADYCAQRKPKPV